MRKDQTTRPMAPIQTSQHTHQPPQPAQFAAAPPPRKRRGCFGCLGRALIGNKRTKKEGKRALEKYVRVGPDGPLRQEAERLLRRR